jgi:hypothetical protein
MSIEPNHEQKEHIQHITYKLHARSQILITRSSQTPTSYLMSCQSHRAMCPLLDMTVQSRSVWPRQTQKDWTKVENLQIQKLENTYPSTTFPKGDICFSQPFTQKPLQNLGFSRFGQQSALSFNWNFGVFPPRISNAAKWMKCVPGDNEQLLHWPILKYLWKMLRTR